MNSSRTSARAERNKPGPTIVPAYACALIAWAGQFCRDGSVDSLVHCITPAGMAADAAASISAETTTLLRHVNKGDLDTDTFASDKEFENDETILHDE